MGDYLPEVFLSILGTDFTQEKVQESFQACEKVAETGKNITRRELVDFWDVIREFADFEPFRDYDIVQKARKAHEEMTGAPCGKQNDESVIGRGKE